MQTTGWRARLLANWTLSGGLTAGSGNPLTARVLGNQSNTGGSGAVGSGRADATGEDVTAGGGFFNPGAFAIPPSGRYGNAARNTIPGPSSVALNLSFGRSFQLHDSRRRVELRVDSTNVLNHVNYTSVATIVNATNYGLPTATQAMRALTAT
ncbi:MAG TPA: hypothetical protein VG672_16230, partial [Bryobacteraceae bacterium]|nr:hypothetical protein [Bryobacteraceae bacterium]